MIIRDGRVLLGRRAEFRASYPGKWDFIGGKIEEGETPKQALSREMDEEIGIAPLAASCFDTIRDRHLNPDAPPVYHFFRVVDWVGGEPIMNNHEHSDLEWFSLRQAFDLSNLALPEYRDLLTSALG